MRWSRFKLRVHSVVLVVYLKVKMGELGKAAALLIIFIVKKKFYQTCSCLVITNNATKKKVAQ